MIHLTFGSWVARITGMGHCHPAICYFCTSLCLSLRVLTTFWHNHWREPKISPQNALWMINL
jgi:hypothetical protein